MCGIKIRFSAPPKYDRNNKLKPQDNILITHSCDSVRNSSNASSRSVCPQLQAARDPGARPVSCLPAIRWKEDRLPPVQQPEEPQVQRARARLLPEELRRR